MLSDWCTVEKIGGLLASDGLYHEAADLLQLRMLGLVKSLLTEQVVELVVDRSQAQGDRGRFVIVLFFGDDELLKFGHNGGRQLLQPLRLDQGDDLERREGDAQFPCAIHVHGASRGAFLTSSGESPFAKAPWTTIL